MTVFHSGIVPSGTFGAERDIVLTGYVKRCRTPNSMEER